MQDSEITKVLFRASKIGLLAGGLIRHGLTAKQRERMEQLESIPKEYIGLTDKQREVLSRLETKFNNRLPLTPNEVKNRLKYKEKEKTFKKLTPSQKKELHILKEKNARPTELSKGAKTYIKSVWLEYKKQFKEEVTDKKLKKGIQGEEDGIKLISLVDGIMYVNNNKRPKGGRKTKGYLTGACDVLTEFKNMDNGSGTGIDATVVDDIKCCWNARTFMASTLTVEYEWQLRAYMYLYNADIARLRYCLVDCPPDVYAAEYKKFCYQHEIIDDALPQYKDALDQFRRTLIYEETGLYTREERVKTFFLERDPEKEAILLDAIDLAVEYYKTIKLNMIEDDIYTKQAA